VNKTYVLDTVVLVLTLGRLPHKVRSLIEEAKTDNVRMLIPAMVLAEIGYLSEKEKIDCGLDDVRKFLSTNGSFTVLDISTETVLSTFRIKDIPELHDRLIAGAAVLANAPLLTSDAEIRASKAVETVWE